MRQLYKKGRIFRDGEFHLSDFLIEDGLIFKVEADVFPDSPDQVFNLGGFFVFPGFTDLHVHLREPGFLYKETIRTGSLAAARGGYTRVCAMPNLQSAPDSRKTLEPELSAIRRDGRVEIQPYGALTMGRAGQVPADLEGLAPYVCGYSDDGNGIQSESLMRELMLRVKKLGKFIAAHCEDESLLRGGYIHDGAYAAARGHRGICAESEWGPIARDLSLVGETGCRYHVCHISCLESAALIRKAKAAGLPVTCETAPHYLLLDDTMLEEDGRWKMNPPLRTPEDREALVEALAEGVIDCIATDHAPHSHQEKSRGLAGSAMGIVGLETAFPMLYTRLVQTGRVSLSRIMDALTARPMEILGLRGGRLEPGMPADFSVWRLDAAARIDPDDFRSMGRSTPFAGQRVTAENHRTVWKGETVWKKT
ncbi:MAG: dihydroorotase [Christensenellales bacterium]|jgi:dihydroorotase